MSGHDTMLHLLSADGPHPGHAEKLMLFGQLVGSWNLDMVVYGPDGTPRTRSGQWHFGWILQGRAIQDVLIVEDWDHEGSEGAPQAGIGTGLRVYDASTDVWWVVWVGPAKGECNTLLASPVGDRIVLQRQSSLASSERFEWTFSEITEESFSCEGRASEDEGRTWRLVEELRARRVSSPNQR